MALLSSSSSSTTTTLSPAITNANACSSKSTTHKPPYLVSLTKFRSQFSIVRVSASDNGGAGVVASTATVTEIQDKPKPKPKPTPELEEDVKAAQQNKFQNPKWVNGSWDLKQFQTKDGTTTDWDALIDAEARRRKWLESNPESTNNSEPVMFDTSIIPWWAWIKRFHLPEAELLNGRAAMVGFFMAYFVDSLTGLGVVDQTNNFFCKTLLFVAVLGVLFIRKNEDLDNLKKLLQETTLYDKQWQATWQDDSNSNSNKD